MPVIFISKLCQKGITHPKSFNGDNIYSLFSDQELPIEDVLSIVEFHELKLEMMSVLLSTPGANSMVFLENDNTDYAYTGSVWDNEELFNNAVSSLREKHTELILKYNSMRKMFFQKFNIDYISIGLFPIGNTISFEIVDALINEPITSNDDPFDFT